MPKKTVVIFSTAYLPLIGGAEVAIKEITGRITDFDFVLFTARTRRDLPKKEQMGNILVYRLGFGYSFDKFLLPVLAFIKFFQLLQNPKSEIRNPNLWGMMASYGSIAAYFIKLVKPKIRFLLTLQEGDSEDHLKKGKFGLVGFFGRRIIRKADKIQAISNYLKDFASRQGARSPVAVVPNGIDIKKSKYQNSKLQIQKIKQKLNIKDDEKIVITTSRLVYKNGIDILIKAIGELKNLDEKIKIKLLILGDGVLRKDLKNLVGNLGLKNEVLFLGFVEQDKIYEYLKAADIFCRPSRSEGLGNSFLEAMACGIPVIATPVGGIPDFLVDNETGLFSKAEDLRDLAFKINLILNDGNLRNKIIINAKKLVEEKYNWDGISKEVENLLSF